MSTRCNDLFVDLQDGRLLIKLLQILSGEQLPKPTRGRMRIHCLENVDKALTFLSQKRVHLENLGAQDVVDGSPRLTLGLIWTIILRFQVCNTLNTLRSTIWIFAVICYHNLILRNKDARMIWEALKQREVISIVIFCVFRFKISKLKRRPRTPSLLRKLYSFGASSKLPGKRYSHEFDIGRSW